MQGTAFSSALAMELRRRAAAYWWEGAEAATMHLPAESRDSPVGPSSHALLPGWQIWQRLIAMRASGAGARWPCTRA